MTRIFGDIRKLGENETKVGNCDQISREVWREKMANVAQTNLAKNHNGQKLSRELSHLFRLTLRGCH